MPLAAVAGIAAAGSLAGGLISSSGAQNAAQTQSDAALQAAQLQYQAQQQALALQKGQYLTQQQELTPWYMQGQAGLANLSNLLGLPVSGNIVNPGQLAAQNLAGGSPTGTPGVTPGVW